MSNTYETLPGAQGRAQFFRRERFPAEKFFVGSPPTLFFNDEAYELSNISGSGIGALAKGDSVDDAMAEINRVGVLRLMQGGQEIFSGVARLARAESAPNRVYAGFALEGANFNLADLRRRNAVAYAKTQPNVGEMAVVPAEYKAYCADVLDFSASYLARISRSVGPIESELSSELKGEIFQFLYDEIKRPWAAMIAAGNDIVIPHHNNREMRAALKTYTERVVTRTFVKGATWHRSYFKPLGYPGDYQLMNYMYDERPEGDSLEAMFLHSLGLVAGRPIVARMFTLGDLLNEWNRTNVDETFRVTSIGSGPAREFEHVSRIAAPNCRWEINFVDQEQRALEYALSSNPSFITDPRFNAKALNASFTQMLDPGRSIFTLPPQDVIYSLGLVDYLSLPLAAKFAKRMLDYVKPGGRLVIANVNNLSTGITWQAEHVSDWTLYFRSREEMLAMAQGVPEAEIEIREDGIKSVYFLIIRKPE